MLRRKRRPREKRYVACVFARHDWGHISHRRRRERQPTHQIRERRSLSRQGRRWDAKDGFSVTRQLLIELCEWLPRESHADVLLGCRPPLSQRQPPTTRRIAILTAQTSARQREGRVLSQAGGAHTHRLLLTITGTVKPGRKTRFATCASKRLPGLLSCRGRGQKEREKLFDTGLSRDCCAQTRSAERAETGRPQCLLIGRDQEGKERKRKKNTERGKPRQTWSHAPEKRVGRISSGAKRRRSPRPRCASLTNQSLIDSQRRALSSTTPLSS